MKDELADALWLDELAGISLEELAALSGLPAEILRELVEYGVVMPADTQAAQWRFTGDCIVAVRTAGRLRADFDLDPNALAVALTLIGRIRGLERQLRDLRTQLPGKSAQRKG
jgi:hypothetical protein